MVTYKLNHPRGVLTRRRNRKIQYGQLVRQTHQNYANVMVDEFVQQIIINKKQRIMKTVIFRYIIDPEEGIDEE